MTEPLDRAAASFRDGQAVLFVNEIRDIGVVGAPAALVSTEMMNFFISVCRGVVYVALPEHRLASLDIPPQPHTESGPGHVHVPVDAVAHVTTGISAPDRARTVHALIDDDARPESFRQPGHITPMALHPDGLLGRLGLAESVQEAATAAGCDLGVVFCGVLTDEGHMADAAWLRRFADDHGLVSITLADGLRARRRAEGWRHPARTLLDLPYVRRRAMVRAKGGQEVRERLPVVVLDLCVAGHALGGCACAAPSARVRHWLDGSEAAALTAVWPHDGIPSCGSPIPAHLAEALADIVAADHCGAHAELLRAPSADGPDP